MEIFGLKKPFPSTSTMRPMKKRFGAIRMNSPVAMVIAPTTTETRWPRKRSAIAPPARAGEIGAGGVETVDERRQRLRIERPGEPFQHGLHRMVADDVLRLRAEEKVIHHVEGEQCAHAVIAEALPHLQCWKGW